MPPQKNKAVFTNKINFTQNSLSQSKKYSKKNYKSKNILNNVEKNAIVISYEWDYFVSASLYFQTVEHIRNDVTVFDKELLRRSWYFSQLERHYPWLIKNSRNEVDAFLFHLNKFEHNESYDAYAIEQTYRNLIASFITKNISEHPIYVTPEIEAEYTQGFQRIPDGLVFRLIPDGDALPKISPKYFTFRPSEKKGSLPETVLQFYARSYSVQAMYSLQMGQIEDARRLSDEALKIQPMQPQALSVKEHLQKIH